MARNAEGFDAGLTRRGWVLALRRRLVFVVLLGWFVETHGLPEVRLPASDGSRAISYFGVQGVRREPASVTSPLIVLRPLEESLLDYGRHAWRQLITTNKTRTDD